MVGNTSEDLGVGSGSPILPSDGRQFWIALRYEVRLQLRSGRFYALLGIMAAFGIAALAAIVYRGPGTASVGSYFETWLSFMPGYFTTILAVAFAGDVAARDLGTEAGLYTLPLPVRRATLLWGRIAGDLALAVVALLAFTSGVAVSATYAFHAFPAGPLAIAIALTTAVELATIAMVAFISVAFQKPIWGFVLPFVFLLIGLNVAAELLHVYAHVAYWWSLTFSANVALVPFGPEATTPLPGYAVGSLAVAGYILVFGSIATIAFRRREAE
ncbi:membrane protein, partial [mine drainage metagenome]